MFFWLLGAAWAGDGLELVSEGDRARYAGDRETAVQWYREAARSGDPAAEAMARLRLLGLSGNLGALWHGPAIDRALQESSGPWGELAVTDYHLFAPRQVGADPAEGAEIAREQLGALPGPSAARLYLATGEQRWLDALEQAADRDGLGDALVAADGRLPPEPGTWFLGLGVAAAPGAGVGGAVTFAHPDLFWRAWSLSASGAISSRGAASASAAIRSPGIVYGVASGAAYRFVGDLYINEAALTFTQQGARLQAGPGARAGSWRFQVGGTARWDDLGSALDGSDAAPEGVAWVSDPQAGHGAWAGASWDRRSGVRERRRGQYFSASIDGTIPALADHTHLGTFLDARAFVGALGGVSAFRVTWAAADLAGAEAPFYRLPAAGGDTLHRGAWAGRWRSEQIITLDAEQRWPLGAIWEAAVFANAALVSGAGNHPGAGAGIRLILPPEALNVARLDVAISDSGWGIYGGWGEAF